MRSLFANTELPVKIWEKGNLEKWKFAFNPFKSQGFVVAFLLFLLVVFGTGQKVFFKLMLYPMKPYVFMINQVQALSFIPLFFCAAQFNKKVVYHGQWPSGMTTHSKKMFAVIGVMELCNMLLQLLAGAALPGSTQVLLSQVRIPVTMIVSHIFLKTQYVCRQYVGVAITFIGIVIAVAPWNAPESSDSGGGSTLMWSFILMSAAIPSCLANVLREVTLHDQSVTMDPFYLALWIAIFQFVIGIPLFFCVQSLKRCSRVRDTAELP